MTDTNKRTLSPAEFYRFPLPEEFTEASRQFSSHLRSLVNATHRTGTVLHLMQHYYATQNSDDTWLNEYATAEVVDLLIETLPHHETDVQIPLEAFEGSASASVRASVRREGLLRVFFDAMSEIASGKATASDIEIAAGKAFEVYRADPEEFEPEWRTLESVIQSRGYRMEITELNGTVLGPRLMAPELKSAQARADRAIKRTIETANALDTAKRKDRR